MRDELPANSRYARQATAIATLLAALCCGSAAREAQAALITGTQLVDRSVDGAVISLPFNYTSIFDGTKLTTDVQILFSFDDQLHDPPYNFTPPIEELVVSILQELVESIWNNKFLIRDNNTGLRYPIEVKITTDGLPNYNQGVVLHPGFPGDGSSVNNWFLDDESGVFAHEVGHMLGQFDEYDGGALDALSTISLDGVMGYGARTENPTMYERYYQNFLFDMQQLNPGESFSLVAAPEPASWCLGIIGLACLIGIRRARRRN